MDGESTAAMIHQFVSGLCNSVQMLMNDGNSGGFPLFLVPCTNKFGDLQHVTCSFGL